MALLSGSEIAGYRIEGILGRGGMGEVYEATQLSLGRTVALKVLRADLGADVAFRERFRREGRIQAGLDHPNIVTVHEAGELPGDAGLYLAMRLVRGPTLKDLIRGGELTPQRTLDLLAPIAAALDAAHGAGLTHRDVKPQNMLVGPGDHPYLADFGLTRSGEDTALTRSGAFMGTIDYVAPEIIRGEPASAASDVYALTCVIYECLTGEIPFRRETEAAALYAHVNDDPPRRALELGLPARFDEVLAGGMAKDSEDRPVRASELLAGFREAISGAPAASRRGSRTETIADADAEVDAATPPTPAAATRALPATGARRERARVMAAGAVLLAVLAAAAFALGRSGGDGSPAPLTTLAAGSDVALHAPATWRSVGSGRAPRIPGLALAGGIALTSAHAGTGVVAGRSAGSGPTLLPDALRARLVAALPRRETVRLGRLEALRYRDLRVRGFAQPLTLYAVPASTGVATVVCHAPAPPPAGSAATCDRVAATLELQRGSALPVMADPQVARALGAVLAVLERDRAVSATRLRDARTRGTQSAAATGLATAYARAARSFERLKVSPVITPSIHAMATSARAVAIAHRDLATAARTGSRGAYAAAAGRARRAQDALRSATAKLAGAGYHVG